MTTIVLVIHVMIAVTLVAVVLLQRSEGGGLGIGGGGGSMGGLMSGRGTANLLTRSTAVLAGCFMVTSIVLALLAIDRSEPRSIVDQPLVEQAPPEPAAPAVPSVPLRN